MCDSSRDDDLTPLYCSQCSEHFDKENLPKASSSLRPLKPCCPHCNGPLIDPASIGVLNPARVQERRQAWEKIERLGREVRELEKEFGNVDWENLEHF